MKSGAGMPQRCLDSANARGEKRKEDQHTVRGPQNGTTMNEFRQSKAIPILKMSTNSPLILAKWAGCLNMILPCYYYYLSGSYRRLFVSVHANWTTRGYFLFFYFSIFLEWFWSDSGRSNHEKNKGRPISVARDVVFAYFRCRSVTRLLRPIVTLTLSGALFWPSSWPSRASAPITALQRALRRPQPQTRRDSQTAHSAHTCSWRPRGPRL